MPTERIDIIVTERGTRQVKRNIEDLATASDRAESELDQLRASLRNISPTSQLRRTLEQIQSLRTALSAPRTRASWLSTPISEANAGLVQIGQNLRAARREMGTNITWDAVSEFRQAEAELNDVIRKLQTVRSMQSNFITTNNVRDRNTGLAPVLPNVVSLPEVNKFAADAERAARGSYQLASGVDRIGASAQGAHRPFMLLDRYVGAFGAGIVAMELMRLADSATVVANRVNIVSDSLGQANVSLEELYAIARRTRTPIEELSALFQKGMMAANELGVNQAEVLQFVEAVGMALAVQGSSAQTARGALIQLSQAIGTDIVRAEEFNSILEGAYPIALAAARGIDEAGGSVARLRRMVIDGEISSKQFFNAIMSQYPMIAGMFAKTESTISQAFTVFRNKLTEYISTSEEAQAISQALADTIILVADNIEPLADLLFALGASWAVGFTISTASRIAAVAGSASLLLGSLRAIAPLVGATGPIGAGLAIIAGAAFFAYQNIDTAADKVERLRDAMDEGVDALQKYNDAIQIVKQEQEELGGVINLTTEAMLRQSRAELQGSLAELRQEIKAMEDDLEGLGLFNINEVSKAMSELWDRGGAKVRQDPNTGIFGVQFENAEIERLWELLRAVKEGTGSIEDFYAAVERVRGAGPEVTAAMSDLAIAMGALPEDLTQEASAQAQLWLRQAEEQLANIATVIGGLDAQIEAAANAQTLPEKVEALQALADGLQSAQIAGDLVRGSSWISDTADLLKALQDARDLEQSMMEALGANTKRLNELATEAERFRTPVEGAESAASGTKEELSKINFVPLIDGATELADQLERAMEVTKASATNSGDQATSIANSLRKSADALNKELNDKLLDKALDALPAKSSIAAIQTFRELLEDVKHEGGEGYDAEWAAGLLNNIQNMNVGLDGLKDMLDDVSAGLDYISDLEPSNPEYEGVLANAQQLQKIIAGLAMDYEAMDSSTIEMLRDMDPQSFGFVRALEDALQSLEQLKAAKEVITDMASLEAFVAGSERVSEAYGAAFQVEEGLLDPELAQKFNSELDQLTKLLGTGVEATQDLTNLMQSLSLSQVLKHSYQLNKSLHDIKATATDLSNILRNLKMPTKKAPTLNDINAPAPTLISAGVTRDQIGTNGLMTLNSGGTFTVGGNGGVDQNLISFWASKGEQVTVTPRGKGLVESADRSGQSREYLNTLQLINQELETRYDNLMKNNQGMREQQILQDALQIAQREGTVLAQQDIQLIQERATALEQLGRRLDLLEDIGGAVFDNLKSSLDTFIENGTFNFNEFASSVIKDLARIGMQMMIIAPLKNFFGNILGNLMPSLPGFNEGADFTVGGTGGVDKNVVAFRASRGERVQVTPAGKQGSDGNSTVVFNISTPDVEGFRRSEAQMAARAQRMLARGQRNS